MSSDEARQGRWERRLHCFCTATRFLTILPLAWGRADDGRFFRASLPLFPLVGLCIGLAGFLLSTLLLQFVPLPVVAFLAVAGLAALTGGLHLDGLADSADGLLSHRPREQALRIMKDSRIGAMGVIALLLVLLGKYVAFSTLDLRILPLLLLLVPLAGRCAILLCMARLDYVGEQGGVGGHFYRRLTLMEVFPGWLLLFLLSALLLPGFAILLPFLLVTIVLLFARWCRNRLGGCTGDTLGASCELAETVTALAGAMLIF